jgi:hypothetical protein
MTHKSKFKFGVVATFYMDSYLMDLIYVINRFPELNWSWNMSKPPMHVYCQMIWEKKYKKNYARLCDFFLVPLYRLILCKEFPRLSKESMRLIKNIGNWYLQEDCTYLRIYGVTASPHLLPKYVPNRLILGEIDY